jgi:type IV secretion system protein VirB9
MRGALIGALALAAGAPFVAQQHAWAAESPHPGSADARIQSIEYDPDQVVELRAAMGNQLMLEFGPGEKLENVAIGDSLGWQVTPNKRADLLFIKPLDPKSVTNMTVVTSLRHYAFEMRVLPRRKGGGGPVAPYLVRFLYPARAMAIPIAPEPEKPPQVVNSNYEVTGSPEARPLRVFDDGHMVYFQWPADAAVPAIFAVADDKSESLVNYVVRGSYTVVEQMGARFVLRNGKQVATIINRGYTPQVAGNAR